MSVAVAPAPSSTPQPSAEVARARVAVMVATYQVDVVVPTKFTIETFIDDLLAVLAGAIDDEEVDFRPPSGQWSLARPGEAPMPRWRTLADHEVVDGAVLMLSTVESPEIFTPVVEDITDALATINEREFAEMDRETVALVGVAALALGAVGAAVLLVWSWTESGSLGWCGLPALLLGLAFSSASLISRRRRVARPICLGLALSALPLLFAGGAMLVPPAYHEPGGFSSANIAAGGVVAAVAAVTMMRIGRFGFGTLISAAMIAGCLAVAALPAAYADVSMRRIAAGVVFVGLILLTAAPRIAVVVANIRPPDLPDPGNEVAPATLTDIFDAESAREGDSDQDDDDTGRSASIESRARLAVTSLRGLLTAVAVLVASSTIVAAAASPGGIREIVMAAAVAGILVLRARWHPDRVQAIALIAAAAAIGAGVGFVEVGAYHTPAARLLVVAVVVAAATAGCAAALRLPGTRLSPVTRRVIDLLEYAMIVVVPVIAFWIMGIYTAMRAI